MGAFQSKKKYDVAIGESTIKGKYQTSRNDRKQDHLSRISQHNDKLNKHEFNDNGENRDKIIITSREENVTYDQAISAKEKLVENGDQAGSTVEKDVSQGGEVISNLDQDQKHGSQDKLAENVNQIILAPDEENVLQDKTIDFQEILAENDDKIIETYKDVIEEGKSVPLEILNHQEVPPLEESLTHFDENPIITSHPGEENTDSINETNTTELESKATKVAETNHESVIENERSSLEAQDIESPELPKTSVDENGTQDDSLEIIAASENIIVAQNLEQQNVLHETIKDDSDSLCQRQKYHADEKFLDEERKSYFDTVRPADTENEQEAITVLNEIIDEAAGPDPDSHLEESPVSQDEETPPVRNESENVPNTSKISLVEHSRKRVITGDHPSEEEIIKAAIDENEEKVTPQNGDAEESISTIEMQEVSLVGESYYTNKQGEKIGSHIYLESANSDEVHYTLDKLQLMEEQIQSSRSRIMSIKEID